MPELGDGYEDPRESGYFTVLPTPVGLLGGVALLEEASALARNVPGGQEVAAAAQAVIGSVERNVNKAAIATAQMSEKAIIERINQTRVRPNYDTFGGMFADIAGSAGRKRLEEGIKSDALGLGAVGIGSIAELDTVVGIDGRPFWRAQEYGSSHNVGRVVVGLFQPGNSLPDPQLFRQHPVFIAGPGGPMHIQRPIPARHFLRDGAEAAASFRETEFGSAEGVAIDEIRAIRALLA